MGEARRRGNKECRMASAKRVKPPIELPQRYIPQGRARVVSLALIGALGFAQPAKQLVVRGDLSSIKRGSI